MSNENALRAISTYSTCRLIETLEDLLIFRNHREKRKHDNSLDY